MFKAGQPNPYDDIVAKTTDENLTSENWELILNLCDKVVDEGEQGARNVIAAILKRLAHRNPNVQLYALSLSEALSKNCGVEVHREIASRSFTASLERLITDRTTHDKVRRKALSLVAMWAADFESDPQLGLMEECYTNLKTKNYRFEETQEPPPPQVDDEVRRREEEELQRVLELSMHDKGGLGRWQSYDDEGSNAASSSKQSASSSRPTPAAAATSSSARPRNDYGYAAAASGYVPAAVRTPSPERRAPAAAASSTSSLPSANAASNNTAYSYAQSSSTKTQSQTSLALSTISRVRALHSFEATEQGELTFEKGDVIKVIDRNYKDWWRGQLKGRIGIFPVNYVELLPDPTPDEIAKEAEHEAAVFAQAANIDKLLSMLRGLDPAKDNLADNEEIQELYRSSMSLRPKIVKLIDKYSQKRAELVSMNEAFVKARTIFDRLMEESLARHSGLYDGRPPYQQPGRPDSRARQDYRPNSYGAYEQPGYGGFPQPKPAYVPKPDGMFVAPTPVPQSVPYADPNVGTYAQQQGYGPGYPGGPVQQGPTPYGQPQGPVDPAAAAAYGGYPQQQQQLQQGLPQQAVGQAQAQTQPQVQPQAQVQVQPQQQPQAQAQIQPQAQTQPQVHAQPDQNVAQDPVAQGQQQQQQQVPAQTQAQTQPQTMQGPPYVFDPNATYPDPNAQAWAQYYAQGGTDPAGKVYFISVPGLDGPQGSAASVPQAQQQTTQQPVYANSAGSVSSVNGSNPSVHAQYAFGPEHGAQQQGVPSSPTFSRSSSNFPASTGGVASPKPTLEHHLPAQQQQQQYQPAVYANPAAGQPQPINQDPHAQYAQQYAQMHGQFSGMAVGERSPTNAGPAAQPVQ